jgi:phosphopantothenoylcysteine decarboxylase/phosphopantothenate--cysteine ligase
LDSTREFLRENLAMNCIVTAGPTFEPLDEVRRLTNFSTGRLGTELGNFLAARGHQVTLLIGEGATWAGPRQTQRVHTFATTRDLFDRFQSLTAKRIDAIFHAAAVSDFTFGRVFARDEEGQLKPFRRTRKLSTRQGNLLVELRPTVKIISRLRAWYPHTLIVGWKFEADGRRADALVAGQRQLADCATDACVANGPAYGAGFGLLTATRQQHFPKRAGLFAGLAALVAARNQSSSKSGS